PLHVRAAQIPVLHTEGDLRPGPSDHGRSAWGEVEPPAPDREAQTPLHDPSGQAGVPLRAGRPDRDGEAGSSLRASTDGPSPTALTRSRSCPHGAFPRPAGNLRPPSRRSHTRAVLEASNVDASFLTSYRPASPTPCDP